MSVAAVVEVNEQVMLVLCLAASCEFPLLFARFAHVVHGFHAIIIRRVQKMVHNR